MKEIQSGSKLDPIFKPNSIVIVGASNKPGKVGYELVKNIIDHNFSGYLYLVNPKGGEVLGIKMFKDIRDVPNNIDLALIALSANKVPELINVLHNKGIKSAIIYSSGFSEVGNVALEEELVNKCRKYGIRVVGPNCAGIIYWGSNLYASFVSNVNRGDMALISQSGAFTAVIVEYLNWKETGLALLVSYGNRIDVNEIEILDYFSDDENIKSFMIYLEGLRRDEGRKFVSVIRKVINKKPIVILKAGRGGAGERAVKSHTGALAGNYKLYNDILSSIGVALVDEFYELVDVSEALAILPKPTSNNIVLITNSGGPAAILTDFITKLNLSLPELPSNLKNKLKFLPSYMGRVNPIDLTANGLSDIYYETLKVMLKEPWVGCLLVIHVPPSFVNPIDIAKAIRDVYLDINVEKPLIPLFLGPRRREAYHIFSKDKLFPTPYSHRSAALSVKWLYNYWRVIAA